MSEPLRHQLTLDTLFAQNEGQLIVLCELLRRYLELRPGLELNLTTLRGSDGSLRSGVALSWRHEAAPEKMGGTWASLCDTESTVWPLLAALRQAARQFEAAERKGSAE